MFSDNYLQFSESVSMEVLATGWIAEDDLLLMTSIEQGASLEALAKGAVRFSRKFTVQELRDRWYSLLYDPIVSAEASARLACVEAAGNSCSLLSKSNNRVLNSNKRKIESVRSLYYSLRKKSRNRIRDSNGNGYLGLGDGLLDSFVAEDFVFEEADLEVVNGVALHDHLQHSLEEDGCREPGMSPGLEFFKEPGVVENIEKNGVDEHVMDVLTNSTAGNGTMVEGIETCQAMPDTGVSFNSLGYSSPLPSVPLWKTMEDITAPVMPVVDSPGVKGQDNALMHHDPDANGETVGSSGYDIHSEAMLKERQMEYEMNNSGVIAGTDFSALHDQDPLSDFVNENEQVMMDTGGVATTDKSCFDSVSALLLNSPNDVHEDKAKDFQTLDSFNHMNDNDHSKELHMIPDPELPYGHDEQRVVSSSEGNIPSSSLGAVSRSPESGNEMICCLLNTEDPEIPSNDDILFSLQPRAAPANMLSGLPVENDRGQESGFSKVEDSKVQHLAYQTAPKMGRENVFPENNRISGSKFHDFQNHTTSRHNFGDQADPCSSRSPHGFPDLGTHSPKEDAVHKCNMKNVSLPSEKMLAANTALHEVDLPSEISEYESEDEHIPSFSDIEAMVLEMDLCPDDSDAWSSRVSRYQGDDAMRTIIRLEQCAQSAIQRAIALHGAFAVLYGRRLKHYIKETEVTLGRATEEIDVDIDLGKEGQANKISRRQALIKMDCNGSFTLKNLGKSSVFLNGKEVITGQLMNLGSSSLIEIRDLAFVFEINHKAVTRHLARMKEQNTKFEWCE